MTALPLRCYRGRLLLAGQEGAGWALLLALLPVLLAYRVPGLGVGLSTALLLAGGLGGAVLLCCRLRRATLRLAPGAALCLAFALYTALRSGTARSYGVQMLLAALLLAVAASGAVSGAWLRRWVVGLALLACGLVLAQSLLHGLTGLHLPGIAPDACLAEMEPYRDWILTGHQQAGGLYRPSAFFLEPAHLAQYAAMALLLVLQEPSPRLGPALFLTLGMAVSTSGLGLGLAAWAWCCFFWGRRRAVWRFGAVRLALAALGAAAVLLVLLQLPTPRAVLGRLLPALAPAQGGYNALWGRTLYGRQTLALLQGRALWLGLGYGQLPQSYLTGAVRVLAGSGLVGGALYYGALAGLARRGRGAVRRMALAVAALSLVANTTGALTLAYQLGLLLALAAAPAGEGAVLP